MASSAMPGRDVCPATVVSDSNDHAKRSDPAALLVCDTVTAGWGHGPGPLMLQRTSAGSARRGTRFRVLARREPAFVVAPRGRPGLRHGLVARRMAAAAGIDRFMKSAVNATAPPSITYRFRALPVVDAAATRQAAQYVALSAAINRETNCDGPAASRSSCMAFLFVCCYGQRPHPPGWPLTSPHSQN